MSDITVIRWAVKDQNGSTQKTDFDWVGEYEYLGDCVGRSEKGHGFCYEWWKLEY